ncbi:uncharacterized protein LOC116253476 [Nymphaea colorata]|nr:uncharacterized protein LOC116253476 [Nymphaea colorata]
MGKAVASEKQKKKKKGRPSLSDLQQRSPLPPPPPPPQQRQQNDRKRSLSPSQAAHNPNPKSTPRRITRRYVSLLESKEEEGEDDEEKEEEEDDDNDDDDDERRKEKKLKLVLRLNRSSRPRSPSSLGNSRDRTTEDGAPGSDSNDESESGEKPPKKRTIDSVTEMAKPNLGNGSAVERVEKGKHDQNGDRTTGRTPPGSITGTPLPNEKLLFFILERLQKKDTYGVFSEPVDPEELPDYHDVIKHPMDFSTVKKKLSNGVYTTLEQFESDVFLICSNAMRYNAPETIYFRQARSIQELAKKNFQNIRQNSDGTEQDSRPQRGRPSLFKKFMQQSATKPSVEPAASDSDAAVANAGGDNSACRNIFNNTKRPSVSEKVCSLPDAVGRVTLSFRDSDMSTSFTENKFMKNDEVSGVMLRVINVKHGRKPFVSEENRRQTYNISSWSANRRDPVWTGLDIEKRQLMPVGLHVEHAYARSLARFAASLGPVAWKIAACKIEKVLPPGMGFGPGWIGETEAPLSRNSLVKVSPSVALPTAESKPDTPEMNVPPKRPLAEGHVSPKISQGRPPAVNESASLSSKGNSNTSFSPGMYNTKVPLQNHQNSGVQVSPNGFISRFAPPPMVKQGHVSPATSAIRPGRPQGNVGLTSSKAIAEAIASAHLLDAASRNSNATGMVPSKLLEPQQPGLVDGKILTHGSNNTIPECTTEGRDRSDNQAGSMNSSNQLTSWRGPSFHQKPDSTPPDLNIGFQSPASPARQMLVDTQQPDLALQL